MFCACKCAHCVIFAGLFNSPLPQRSLLACGSVCRSPELSYWRSLRPSQASETAATAHKADPYLELNEGIKMSAITSGASHTNYILLIKFYQGAEPISLTNSLLFSFM